MVEYVEFVGGPCDGATEAYIGGAARMVIDAEYHGPEGRVHRYHYERRATGELKAAYVGHEPMFIPWLARWMR